MCLADVATGFWLRNAYACLGGCDNGGAGAMSMTMNMVVRIATISMFVNRKQMTVVLCTSGVIRKDF